MNLSERFEAMRTFMSEAERGQATIFVAIVMFLVLVPVMGLAVEGGNMLTTYRKMQAAADMAAIVGAQRLPSNPTQSQQDACNFAQKNGFGGGWGGTSCAAGNGAQATACIAPAAKSPYGETILPFGGNGTCPTTPGNTPYIEVQIQKNFATIPVFNIPITLGVHAVARNGIPGAADYSIIALHPDTDTTNILKFSLNNGLVSFGSVESNNLSNSSINQNGGGVETLCQGTFLTASTELDPSPSKMVTMLDGSPVLAPASCTAGGTGSSSSWESNINQIADPYGSTVMPTLCSPLDCSGAIQGNMYSNCPVCAGNAWYYSGWSVSGGKRVGGTWTSSASVTQANQSPQLNNNDLYEFFPGYYPYGITINGGTAYFNPGVYTLGGDLKVTGGIMCIYGAPVCDVGTGSIPGYSFTCSSAVYSTVDAPPALITPARWYKYCSPWGVWDSSTHTGAARPASLPTSAPTFYNSTTLLNGVTFVLTTPPGGGTAASVKVSGGGGGTSGSMAMAFPNACPGSGVSVDPPAFPGGSSTKGGFTGTLPTEDGVSTTGTYIYPSADLTKAGECNPSPTVWNGEFGTGATATTQHLHFLVFSQNNQSSVTLTGNFNENWYGIIHAFPAYGDRLGDTAPLVSDECANGNCAVNIGGGAGGANGPPMLYGQVIGDNESFSGNSLVEVFNRPGGRSKGPGTSLVE